MRSGVGLQVVVLSGCLLADAVRGIKQVSQSSSMSYDGHVTMQSERRNTDAQNVTMISNVTTKRNTSDAMGLQHLVTTAEVYQLHSGSISRLHLMSYSSRSLLNTLSVAGGIEMFVFFLLGIASVFVMAIAFWFFGWRVVRKKPSEAEEEPVSDDPDEESFVPAEMVDKMLSQASSMDIEFIQPSWTSVVVKNVLESFKINIQKWRPEHFDFLARELAKGRARLCRDGDMLVRVLDIVIVILTYEPEDLVIQEGVRANYKRGGFEEMPEKTLKTRLQAGENPVDAATRCLCEKLGFDDTEIEARIRIHPDILNMREAKEMNDSLPGLTSMPRFYVVEANVISTESDVLDKLGITSKTLEIGESMYTWEKAEKLPRIQKHLRFKYASALRQSGMRWKTFDHSIVGVLPWNENELTIQLGKYGSNTRTPFGRPLENTVRGLQDGRLALGLRRTSGKSTFSKLLCVSQEVRAVVQTRKGNVLVADDGSTHNVSSSLKKATKTSKQPPRLVLPSTLKFSNEGVWMAAFRLAQIDLKLSVPLLSMDARLLCVADHLSIEDATLRREFIVSGPTWPSH